MDNDIHRAGNADDTWPGIILRWYGTTAYVCRELLGLSDEEFVEMLTENLFE